jgi:superfamily I DNA/RNA helicase
LDVLIRELGETDTPYSLERDIRFGQLGEIVGWLQGCTQWALDLPTERTVRFRDLAEELRRYLIDAGRPDGRSSLAAAEFLYPALDADLQPEALLLDWLNGLVNDLSLRAVLAEGEIHAQELEALDRLVADLRGKYAGTTVEDFAGPVRRPGRLVVTTYHSAKSRQFDAVILPGLQEGFMPRARKLKGQWRETNVNHDRNLFYVAFTRARHCVAMLSSENSEDAYGDRAAWPRSRFVNEIEAQLK